MKPTRLFLLCLCAACLAAPLSAAKPLVPVIDGEWWLAQRMTRYGLIGTSDPLETGCDNTPRLDQGPVLADDMNS